MFSSFFQRDMFTLDFRGQQLAEKFYEFIILGGTAAGWIVGFIFQRLSYCIYAWMASVVLAALIVLPPWPCYRRNPVKWADPVPMYVDADGATTHSPQAAAVSGGGSTAASDKGGSSSSSKKSTSVTNKTTSSVTKSKKQ